MKTQVVKYPDRCLTNFELSASGSGETQILFKQWSNTIRAVLLRDHPSNKYQTSRRKILSTENEHFYICFFIFILIIRNISSSPLIIQALWELTSSLLIHSAKIS